MAGYDVACPICGGYCELVEGTQKGDGLKLVFQCCSCKTVWTDLYQFPCVHRSETPEVIRKQIVQ